MWILCITESADEWQHADARRQAAEGGQWVRREVPLMVQPQPQAAQLFPDGLHNLLSVLFEEEREAYSAAIESAADRYVMHYISDPVTTWLGDSSGMMLG